MRRIFSWLVIGPFFPVKCEMAIFFLRESWFHSSREAWFRKIIFRETWNKCLIRREPWFSYVFVILDNRYYVINDIAWPWRHGWSLLRQRGWSGFERNERFYLSVNGIQLFLKKKLITVTFSQPLFSSSVSSISTIMVETHQVYQRDKPNA